MKTSLLALAILSAALPCTETPADQYVQPYVRSDGTFVSGYMRSEPNAYKFDNYSSRGNTNPYTGNPGYGRSEFTNPPSYNWGSSGYGNYGSNSYGYRR